MDSFPVLKRKATHTGKVLLWQSPLGEGEGWRGMERERGSVELQVGSLQPHLVTTHAHTLPHTPYHTHTHMPHTHAHPVTHTHAHPVPHIHMLYFYILSDFNKCELTHTHTTLAHTSLHARTHTHTHTHLLQ